MAVVSGFHSRLERDVLDILLRGRCGIICVLARHLYKVIPEIYRDAYGENRILFISTHPKETRMTSRYLCHKRNEYVATLSDRLVFSSITPDSSLYPLYEKVREFNRTDVL